MEQQPRSDGQLEAEYAEYARRMEVVEEYETIRYTYEFTAGGYERAASRADNAAERLESAIPEVEELDRSLNVATDALGNTAANAAHGQGLVDEAAGLFTRSSSAELGAETAQLLTELEGLNISGVIEAIADRLKTIRSHHEDIREAAQAMRLLAEALRKIAMEASGIAQEAGQLFAAHWPHELNIPVHAGYTNWRNTLQKQLEARQLQEAQERRTAKRTVNTEDHAAAEKKAAARRAQEAEQARLDRLSKRGMTGYDDEGYPLDPKDWYPDEL